MVFIHYWWLQLTSRYQACCPFGSMYLSAWLKAWRQFVFNILSSVVETQSTRIWHWNILFFRFIEPIKTLTYLRVDRLTHFFLCSVCWGYPFHRLMGQPCEWAECLTEASLKGGRIVTEMSKVTRWLQKRRRRLYCAAHHRGRRGKTLWNQWVTSHPGPEKFNCFLKGLWCWQWKLQDCYFIYLQKQCPALSFNTEVIQVFLCSQQLCGLGVNSLFFREEILFLGCGGTLSCYSNYPTVINDLFHIKVYDAYDLYNHCYRFNVLSFTCPCNPWALGVV